MTTENTTITKKNDVFLVENIEDMLIRVEGRQVAEISKEVSGVETNEVVILLATIKLSRMVVAETTTKMSQKADYELATRAIIELLNCYSIDNLISIFEDMKYIHIKEVLESDDPISKLELYR